jgi:hypothetical protein
MSDRNGNTKTEVALTEKHNLMQRSAITHERIAGFLTFPNPILSASHTLATAPERYPYMLLKTRFLVTSRSTRTTQLHTKMSETIVKSTCPPVDISWADIWAQY